MHVTKPSGSVAASRVAGRTAGRAVARVSSARPLARAARPQMRGQTRRTRQLARNATPAKSEDDAATAAEAAAEEAAPEETTAAAAPEAVEEADDDDYVTLDTSEDAVDRVALRKELAKRGICTKGGIEVRYLQDRTDAVMAHFPNAYAVDGLLFRLEVALNQFGFNGSNSIGIVNLCRDEATNPLRQKIEEIFPLVFNINGLGGGLTCGVTGMGAGLSHSPVFPANANGRKRYIFFSCPHIAIDSAGNVGSCSRPGQIATNAACGAMIGALGQFQAEGLEAYAKKADSVHDAADPEYSIFKQRLASRVLKEKKQLKDIDLVELTKIAERQISADLDFLISKAVSVEDADYAVVTGVQIHNWGEKFDNEEPNLEMVAPTKVMVVVNGEKTVIDLKSLPSPSPRQLRILTKQVGQDSTSSVAAFIGDRTVTDINGRGPFSSDHSAKAADQKKREATFFKMLLESEGL